MNQKQKTQLRTFLASDLSDQPIEVKTEKVMKLDKAVIREILRHHDQHKDIIRDAAVHSLTAPDDKVKKKAEFILYLLKFICKATRAWLRS